MKTTFTIEADTTAMKVTLRVKQGGKLQYRAEFNDVCTAAEFLIHNITTVMMNREKDDA